MMKNRMSIIFVNIVTGLFILCSTGLALPKPPALFIFAGEKQEAFITSKNGGKTVSFKLLNHSAGRAYFNFQSDDLGDIAKAKGYVGHIGFFYVAEKYGGKKYFVGAHHIEITKLKEMKPLHYIFEGISWDGLKVDGYLKVEVKKDYPIPQAWDFEIKAYAGDGKVFYEIKEAKSDWAIDIISANSKINFGMLSEKIEEKQKI